MDRRFYLGPGASREGLHVYTHLAHALDVPTVHHPVVLAVLLAGPAVALAQPDAPADPFVAVADVDPLDLARVARSMRDADLLARLDDGAGAEIRLAAIRATPWLRAPEAALPELATIARGRDPDLAPAAALAIASIARAIDADALVERETAPDVAGFREALTAVAEDSSARPDVVRAAAIAAERLDSSRTSPEIRP